MKQSGMASRPAAKTVPLVPLKRNLLTWSAVMSSNTNHFNASSAPSKTARRGQPIPLTQAMATYASDARIRARRRTRHRARGQQGQLLRASPTAQATSKAADLPGTTGRGPKAENPLHFWLESGASDGSCPLISWLAADLSRDVHRGVPWDLVTFRFGHLMDCNSIFQPVGPLVGLLHQSLSVRSVVHVGPRVVVRHPRPQVARILFDVSAQPPCRQIIRITACSRHVTGRDTVSGKAPQVRRIELHRPDIVGAVRV